MKKRFISIFVVLLLVLSQISFVYANDTQDWSKYTWDLTEFFSSDAEFQKACSTAREGVQFLNSCKGKIHIPDTFIQFNNAMDTIYDSLEDILFYAMLSFQKNYTSSEATTSYVLAREIYNNFFAANRMFFNEIATMEDAKFNGLIKDPRLVMIASQLKEIRKDPANADYNDDKKMIDELNNISDFQSIYSTLVDGELGGATIIDESGKAVPVNSIHLVSPDERVRKDALDAINFPYLSKQNTLASIYDKHVRQSLANNKFNGNSSTLEAQLKTYQVSSTAYDKQMSNYMNNISSINKKFDIQRKALGYEKMEEYNMYQSYLPSVGKQYTLEDARKEIIAASQPLGEEYISILNKAFDEHWIDAKPSSGKYSGGFTLSTGKHPFILVNFYGSVSDVATLAHELGHAVHMYLTSLNQPEQYQNTPYVTSEIASTTNETLFYRYKLNNAKDSDEVLYYTALLEDYISNYGMNSMKQAKIEEIAHDAVLTGSVLTADFMNKTALNVLKQFYGPTVNVAESSKIYWAKIPHYYSDFYVFNYAMSYTSTNMIIKNISSNQGIDKYLSFLKAGSSKPAMQLIKDMGVDLESDVPYNTLYTDYQTYLNKECELLSEKGLQMSDNGSIQVVYKGKVLAYDLSPASIEYVTMVDAEATLRQMGMSVSSDTATLTATGNGTTFIFRGGQQEADINGAAIDMQRPVQTIQNKLFVPVRFLADQLGLSISYNERTKTVILK